jgi:tetratricopeptide (TPR) repeat protein
MNFNARRMLKYGRASQSEQSPLAGSACRRIHDNHETGLSILVRFGISGILLAGLVTSAGAQAGGSATYYLNRGVERYKAGDFEAAIVDFSEAIEINSGFVKRPTRKLSDSNFNNNQKADIAHDDRIIVADSFNAVAYYNRGMSWYAKGDDDRAIDDFNTVIGINPRYLDAYLIRGRVWHSKGDLARAIADYDRAIVLDPHSAFAYNNRGIARKDVPDLPGAISDFDRAITLDPQLVAAYINRGAARCAVGDMAGATADLNYAIAREPFNSSAYNNRGTIRQAAGDLTAALDDYNKAILLDPENALAYLNRGLAHLQQLNMAEAEMDFKQALELDPELKPDIERLVARGNQRNKDR